MRSSCLLVFAGLFAACATPKSDAPADTGAAAAPAPGAQGDADSVAVARLEAEARALVRDSTCANDSQCSAAPLGARACGGPRDYLPYCRLSTDTVALFAKLAELETAEKAWNEKKGAMSTCEFREPPKVGVAGGRCVAK
jgi:hypothetical protein